MFQGLREFLNKPDFGLLILRAGLGTMMIAHGVSKMLAGDFQALGQNMALFGIEFGFVFWGFMAALVHTVGGFLVLIGYLFRGACFLIFLTMIVAIAKHVDADHNLLTVTGHAIKTAIAFLGLTLIGPGRFSIQNRA